MLSVTCVSEYVCWCERYDQNLFEKNLDLGVSTHFPNIKMKLLLNRKYTFHSSFDFTLSSTIRSQIFAVSNIIFGNNPLVRLQVFFSHVAPKPPCQASVSREPHGRRNCFQRNCHLGTPGTITQTNHSLPEAGSGTMGHTKMYISGDLYTDHARESTV